MNPYSHSQSLQIPPQSYQQPTTGYEPNAMTAAAPPGLGPDAALDWYLTQHRLQQTAPATAFHTAAQTPLPLQNMQPAQPSLLQAFGMQQGPMFTEQDLRVPQSANMLYGFPAQPPQPAMPSNMGWTSPPPQVTSWTLPILGADRQGP